MGYRIGIDVGGTFTDICIYDSKARRLDTQKTPTTPDDPGSGVHDGLENAARERGVSLPDFMAKTDLVVYGTTVSTNAVITRRVARVGLLCTAGFRDVLAIREGTKPDVFDYQVDFPEPYVPRDLTLPVRERVSAEGEVLVPLESGDVERSLEFFRERSVEAVAIAFLWSFANPEHELAAQGIVRELWPAVPCVASHEVNPIPREYRRTIATVIDASLHHVVDPHLRSVEKTLRNAGLGRAELLIASCGGGVMGVREIIERPIYTVGSGPTMAPTGGRVAADGAVEAIGDSRTLLVVDMGGTSFDISLVNDGRVAVSRERKVGADLLGISRVDVHSIGAGGGSIAYVDEGGVLHVGPDSAGAVPGPACYGRGGSRPTVTDADALLGYLDPAGLVGGTIPLHLDASHEALATIGADLECDTTIAAYAIYSTVNQNMVSGIEAVTVREGVDPTDTMLVAGGGACGVHVAGIAEELGISKVLVPAHAGALSAWGTLASDISHEFSAARYMRSSALDLDEVNALLSDLVAGARTFLASTGRPESTWDIEGFCEARYVAQIWELDIPLPGLALDEQDLASLVMAFHKTHDRTFGFSEENQVLEFLQWRVRGTSRIETPEVDERVEGAGLEQRRKAYFGDHGWLDADVLSSGAVHRGRQIEGPALVQELTTTVVVPPNWRMEVVGGDSYLLTREQREPPAGSRELIASREGVDEMTGPTRSTLSPRLISVLAAQCRAVTVHMSNSLLRSARSGVIASARDFSSVLLLGDARPLALDEGLPVHAGGAHLAIEAVLEAFDDIEEGDYFLNNSPFMGNTHHADFTLCAPVFYENELLFWVLSRAHQADCGAPIPSTYLPFAATVQEEGIHLPCVRVRRRGQELRDVLRILTHAVRVPDLCYADYQAQAGALRVGERRLIEMCKVHSRETLKQFAEEWIAYGDRMMAAAIRRLPRAEWEGESRHDSTPFAPEGIPVRAKMRVDPDSQCITVDLRENVDNVAGGLNLTEATTLAAVYGGVLNNVGPEVPRNAGSLARIEVLLREGAAVGIPTQGVGTSVATTNLCDRLFNLIQSMFANAGSPHGIAEGSCGGPPSFGVISGIDRRTDSAYVNQTIIGFGGGPAVHGHDGWLTYNKAVCGGGLRIDSVEINEQRFPVVYDMIELVSDTAGAGQWIGASSVRTQYGPRFDEMQVAYYGDARENPPKGVAGGNAGGPTNARKRRADGSYIELPSMGVERLLPGERIESTWSGGGGYGDPLDRDPARVRDDAEAGLTSSACARERYGVVLTDEEEGLVVDVEQTNAERRNRRAGPERHVPDRSR